jgi:hypothetical protein
MKSFITIITIFLLSFPALAQNKYAIIEGTVADAAGTGLSGATVILMASRDSVIASFGISAPDGHFKIKKVEQGEYLLQINSTGFETHYQTIVHTGDLSLCDIGKVVLLPQNALLHAVDITAERVPLRMRNDTLEYNAGAFQTQPGSVVEDLLKKLPGVEIQSDGSIRAQGHLVQNVLVDGKEFFGQDPKIATKNLPADAVDKVQVFDKRSDRAEFTGIEDGREEKTINLKLKDDAKKGYFGNAHGGYGTSDRYEAKFNLNKFSGKTQVSAIGAANNNNQQAFSFDDYLNFMGGISSLMSGGSSGGRVRISLDDNNMGLPVGPGLNNGFTETWSGGLNLNRDFSKKTKLNASYFYNRLANDLERTASRQNLLNDQAFRSAEMEDRLSCNSNHRLNLTLKSTIDSAQNITFRSNLVLNDAFFHSISNSETRNTENALQNDGSRNYQNDGTNYRGNATLTYRRRFGKRGRALVADVSGQKGNDDRDGNLTALNRYFQAPNLLAENVHQRQVYTDAASNYGASISFTNPLGHKQYLEWQVSHQDYGNKTGKLFYDQTPTPGEIFNPLLSARFQRGYRYERGSMNYMLNRKTFNLTAGAALQQSVLDGQQPGKENTAINRTFTRILPAVFLNVEPRVGRNFSVEYETSLREPTIEQLQPTIDNSDPLNIYTGNPDLKPEYVHDLGLHLMRFDAFTNTMFFADISTTYIRDRITNAGTIDSLFRRNLHPINVNDDLTINGYFNFVRPIRRIKSNLNLTLNTTWNRGILYINDEKNKTDRWVNYAQISLDNRKKKQFDGNIGVRFTQNSTTYSASSAFNQSFINQRYFVDLSIFPNKNWAVNSGLDYQVFPPEPFGTSQQIPIWKAGITRYVLKNRKGQIKLTAYDLLNKNVGISRTSRFNYIEEVRTHNLARYFMVSFAYSISGFQTE